MLTGHVVLKLLSNSNAQFIIAFYRGVLSLKDGIPTLDSSVSSCCLHVDEPPQSVVMAGFLVLFLVLVDF